MAYVQYVARARYVAYNTVRVSTSSMYNSIRRIVRNFPTRQKNMNCSSINLYRGSNYGIQTLDWTRDVVEVLFLFLISGVFPECDLAFYVSYKQQRSLGLGLVWLACYPAIFPLLFFLPPFLPLRNHGGEWEGLSDKSQRGPLTL